MGGQVLTGAARVTWFVGKNAASAGAWGAKRGWEAAARAKEDASAAASAAADATVGDLAPPPIGTEFVASTADAVAGATAVTSVAEVDQSIPGGGGGGGQRSRSVIVW